MTTYEHCDGESGQSTVLLDQNAVDDCSRPGQPADEAVRHHVNRVEWLADDDTIRGILGRYGAWEPAELTDAEENKRRMLWLAACDCCEEPDLYRVTSQPDDAIDPERFDGMA